MSIVEAYFEDDFAKNIGIFEPQTEKHYTYKKSYKITSVYWLQIFTNVSNYI